MVHCARRSGQPAWQPEYLVDLAISDDNPQSKPNDPFGYHSLLLALECEWSANENEKRYDFAKLADVRADRKVFVGFCSSREKADRFVDAAAGFLKQHRHVAPTEEYGIVLFYKQESIEVRAWLLTQQGKTLVVE